MVKLHMRFIKVGICTLLALAASRFIPHPPNFTSLLAISFYIPAFFGTRYISLVVISLIFTDIIIGLHSTIVFTWGSIAIIGLLSQFFLKNFSNRICGALLGSLIFFVLTNFGVWSLGYYEYSFTGLISCYIAAIPFFTYSIISTLFFSILIEIVYSTLKKNLKFKRL